MNMYRHKKKSLPCKEALYWHAKGDGVQCVLCPHNCFLKEGEVGICRTRVNRNSKLVALTYGYPCAMHVDPVEKKPLYHFLPGSKTFSISTTGCNLRCLNCQNYSISQADFIEDEFQFVSPENMVDAALSQICTSISYTYTDPVVYYEYAYDIAVLAKENNLKNIIVSAGYIHKKPLRELCRYIDAANIDLKCFDPKIYKTLSGVAMNNVLDTLLALKEKGVWLEITNLLVPGYSDSIKMIERMCCWLVDNGLSDFPLHFSRFHPTYKLLNSHPTSISILEEAYLMAQEIGIKYVYLGNVRDEKYTNTKCPACNNVIVQRDAYRIRIDLKENGRCRFCDCKIEGVWN
ncbi:AmmeMemoRadiSam system radical SAM enzyme [Saccharicrinis sp. GN24d3]|uniref:AmmeMemoRadiSam system radical SAM enzyme n=1 Tax=Saccharicrinis sp. GN24d3 TaxID=3458416 RepID=UPI004035C095